MHEKVHNFWWINASKSFNLLQNKREKIVPSGNKDINVVNDDSIHEADRNKLF